MPLSASNLARVAEESLTSPVGIRVAKLVCRFPHRDFTGREIARSVGVSHSTIGPSLQMLLDAGLFDMRVVGKAHLYRANRESYLFRVVRDWIRFQDGLGQEMVEMLRSGLRSVAVSAVVFGSYARGEARVESDLDLLLVTDDLKRAGDRLAVLERRFVRRYGVVISTKVLSRAELERKAATAPYLKGALAEGVCVAGRPLRDVIT